MNIKTDYDLLKQQMDSLLNPTDPLITNLSNASALLNVFLSEINWVGFYLATENELYLGPFQGLPACVRIPIGKGVCGTAAKNLQTQLVADVHQFPGHIACDSASNSEIVIPMIVDNQLFGVLDIDSPLFNRFSENDAANLKEIVSIITSKLTIR